MKTKNFPLTFCLLLTLLAMSSCRYRGVLENAPVTLVKTERSIYLAADTSFHVEFPEVMECVDVHIVDDTIMVFYDWINEGNLFKAYSTNSFEYLGSFGSKGRGPSEFVCPYMCKNCPSEHFIYIKENGVDTVYAINVAATLVSSDIQVAQKYSAPLGTLGWAPLAYPRQFVQLFPYDRMFYSICDIGGVEYNTFEYQDNIGSDRYLTYLSSIFFRRETDWKVAEVMIYLPQINFFDTSSGKCWSVAVNTDYRNWKATFNSVMNKETIQYFVEAAASSDYIFTVYYGASLGELIQSDVQRESSIYIFDWEGKFKYDIKVSEDLEHIAFDARNRMLYGIRKSGEAVRYDLSSILE